MRFVKPIIWGKNRTERVNVVLTLCIMYRNISPLPEANSACGLNLAFVCLYLSSLLRNKEHLRQVSRTGIRKSV